MMENDDKPLVPAYVPYKTLINFFNGLRDSGIPSQIDRSVMPGFSGSGQSAVLKSLQFLRLIDKQAKPTALMKQLIDADDNARKPLIAQMIREAYEFIFSDESFHLEKATGNQVAEKFREQGVSGSTVTKCVAFFLAASKEGDIKVSPHIRPPAPVRSTTKRLRGKKNNAEPSEYEEDEDFEESNLGDMDKFQIPIPGKKSAVVTIPKNLSPDDWAMLTIMLNAYIKRLQEQRQTGEDLV